LGVEGKIGFDPGAVVTRSRKISAQLNNGVGFLLKKNKVDIFFEAATIPSPSVALLPDPKKPPTTPPSATRTGVLGAGTYRAKNIIIATGARRRVIPGIEPDGKMIWTYFEAMSPEKFPRSLIVIGSGAIGMEFASFYRTLGTKVTV